jgi:glycosyltransferase involved in cell wall biosynthesis
VADPTVSVIMAVKNGARFLHAAIDSVLAQDLRPIEVVVVDGGSADDSASIAGSYPGVRVVPQAGTGIASAYNTGIDVTSGDLLAFLSSDDLWTPDKLSVQVGFLRPRPQVQYVTARVRFFLEPGCAVPAGFKLGLLEGDHVGHIMETLLARRSVFDLVGRFDPRLSTAEDVDWFSRAHDLDVRTAVVERVLLHKRVHDRNLSLNDAESNRNLLEVVKRSLDRRRERFIQTPPNGDRSR